MTGTSVSRLKVGVVVVLLLTATVGLSLPGFAFSDAVSVQVGDGTPVSGATTETVTVAVWTDARNVAGYQANLSFDPTVVQVTDVNGSADFMTPVATVDNTAGWVDFNQLRNDGVDEPVLAQLTLELVGSSGQETSLTFVQSETVLASASGETVSVSEFTAVVVSIEGDSTPEDPTPEDPTPEDPTPEDPTPEDPTPEDPTPEDPTPEDPTPEDPTPEDPTPEDPTPEDPTPEDPTPEDPTPEDPTPEDPTPEDPTPEDPTPEDPTPEDPTPEDPTPEDPTPEDPTPEDPTPTPEPTPTPTPEPTPAPSRGGSSGGGGGGGSNGGGGSTTTDPASPEFVVRGVNVTTDALEPGETATVVVVVENEGDAAGQYEESLYVGDELVETLTATLGTGETGRFTANYTASIPGAYDVRLGDTTVGQLVVAPTPTAEPTPSPTAQPTETAQPTRETTTTEPAGRIVTDAEDGDVPQGVGVSGGSAPGFGVTVVIVALLALGVIALRRDTR